jgi:hypothetical protein
VRIALRAEVLKGRFLVGSKIETEISSGPFISGKIGAKLLWSIRVRAKLSAFLVAAVALVSPTQMLAHHGAAGYDTTKLVTIKGAVTDFRFGNPHVEISLEVKKDDGSVENWQGELNSPNILARAAGWNRNTLKPRDEVVLVGYRSKNGLRVLRLEKVSLSDGTELFPKGGNGVERY